MKKANYLISAVSYKQINAKKYIAKCLVHRNNETSIGSGSEWTRENIIKSIDEYNVFITIYEENGNWNKGAEVRKIKINDHFYLKTDPTNKEEDNLEKLPEF